MEPSREHCRTGTNTGKGGKYRDAKFPGNLGDFQK